MFSWSRSPSSPGMLLAPDRGTPGFVTRLSLLALEPDRIGAQRRRKLGDRGDDDVLELPVQTPHRSSEILALLHGQVAVRDDEHLRMEDMPLVAHPAPALGHPRCPTQQ